MEVSSEFDLALHRIADATQIPINYINGKLEGGAKVDYEPIPGLKLGVGIKPVKMFFHEQMGVVFHLVGHLWLMIGYYPKTNKLSAFMINQTKLEVDGVMMRPEMLIQSKGTLREAVDVLRPAIVKFFLWENPKWKAAKLPK